MDLNAPSPIPIPVISVRFIDGSEKGKLVHIHKPITTIGHELSKDIVIQGISPSPEFARIVADNEHYILEKRSQDIIIKLNEHIVKEKEILYDGDMIGFGPVIAMSSTFLFENPFGIIRSQPKSAEPISHDPHLEITSNISQIRRIYTLPSSMTSISIGSDLSNDIVIEELVIDPFHIQLIRENNQLKLIHPHPKVPSTTNGLWYKGKHIEGTEEFEHPLSQSDIFHIKNEYGTSVALIYKDGSRDTPSQSQDAEVIVPLDDEHREIIIGRRKGGDFQLNHPTVSPQHAVLVKGRRGYRIFDESGVGSVYVNNRVVKSRRLKPGDVIRVGPYRFEFTDTELKEYDERKSIRIDAFSLTKFGDKKKVLLNEISLAIKPGNFVALVGGSGAGKSTLMDALNGFRPAHRGQVYYNGQDYYSSIAAFRTQLGYVPQDDIVHKDLTVERALYYAAKLRLPKDMVKDRIEKVLTNLKLQPQRKQMVKKLSGGQRKRVSIALELLAEPSIFFLDEPTSGLDPGLDREMMDLLGNLADEGHTVVLVTHATNNINECDYVCFLCQGGRMAYFGPPLDAPAYFNKSDFAEIYSFLEPQDDKSTIPENAEKKFKASSEYQKHVMGLLNPQPSPSISISKRASVMPKRGNPWRQFFLLSLRYMELLKNDWVTLVVLLSQAVVIAGILALIVKFLLGVKTFDNPLPQSNAEKTLFIMAFAAVFFGSLNSAREIVKEVPIYTRERAVNLGIIPYLFSKFFVLGLLCLIQCAVLVVLIDLASGFRKGIFLPVTIEIYITLVLSSFVGLAMGLCVSAFARNSDRAASYIPIILIPQVIFSGIIFKLSGAALILGDLFAVRWAMIGMGSSIDLNGKFVDADSFAFQYTLGHLMLAWGVLVLMIVFFGCLTAFFLKRKDVRGR